MWAAERIDASWASAKEDELRRALEVRRNESRDGEDDTKNLNFEELTFGIVTRLEN